MTIPAKGPAVTPHPAKAFTSGTHRACSPAETVERLSQIAGQLGVTRLADVTGLDCIGIPVFQAVRPNSRSLSVAQGKGLDPNAAMASALGESIEHWHAEYIASDLRLASPNELSSTTRITDLENVPQVTSSRLHQDLAMMWIRGTDLMASGAPTWVPYDLVDLDSTRPSLPGAGCFPRNSNGLASGNTLSEATTHAICEVIERDATTLWEAAPVSSKCASRVDLDSIDDIGCKALLARFELAEVEVGVWETTSDTTIASFRCIILDREDSWVRPLGAFGGYGCHLDRSVALSRALTEAAQSRLTRISGSRDDAPFESMRIKRSSANRRHHRAMLDAEPCRSFSDAPTVVTTTFAEDIDHLLAVLGRVGVPQVVAVDITRPELGVPVVKVVIPGLEGPSESKKLRFGSRALAAASGEQ